MAVSCELPSGIAFVVESEASHPFGMCDGGSHSNPGVFKSERSPELPGSLLGQWRVSLKLHHNPTSPCSHFCFCLVFPLVDAKNVLYAGPHFRTSFLSPEEGGKHAFP